MSEIVFLVLMYVHVYGVLNPVGEQIDGASLQEAGQYDGGGVCRGNGGFGPPCLVSTQSVAFFAINGTSTGE